MSSTALGNEFSSFSAYPVESVTQLDGSSNAAVTKIFGEWWYHLLGEKIKENIIICKIVNGVIIFVYSTLTWEKFI